MIGKFGWGAEEESHGWTAMSLLIEQGKAVGNRSRTYILDPKSSVKDQQPPIPENLQLKS